MASIYEELGQDTKTVLDEAGTQTLGGEVPDVGVYDAEMKQIYIRKTDKGAKMLCLDMTVTNDEGSQPLFWETCIAAGDEKNNKPTFGMTKTMPHIFQALGNVDPKFAMGEVVHKGEKIQAMGFSEFKNGKMVIGLRHEENEWNNSINLKPLLETFLNRDGKNSNGDDLKTELAEKIAKNPVKKLKPSAAAPAATASGAATAAAKGW